MKLIRILAVVALSGGAALVPLTAAQGGTSAETGCRDIIPVSDVSQGSNTSYKRIIDKATAQPGALPLVDPPTVSYTYQSRGVLDAYLALAAPACADVTYSVTAYAPTITSTAGATAIATFSALGDGISTRVHLVGVVDGFTDSCVTVVLSTADRRGAIDLDPNSPDVVKVCESGGGGTAFTG